MGEPDEILIRALEKISDNLPVDWDVLEASVSSEPFKSLLDELKVVARVAEFASWAPVTDQDSSPADRLTWGHLKILAKVGDGAHGEVYRAWDSRLEREVCLKVLRHRADDPSAHSSSVIREGSLLARVRHPNVVAVYGADRLGDCVGIWMEFIHGPTLGEVLKEHGSFEAQDVARIGVELCRALTAVHGAGLIHGDVKAHNVMREDGGRIVLMDFGGAALREVPSGLTGTPLYLAPELLRGASATAQADIYSLGVLLFRLLTGEYPVRGTTLEEVRDAHEQGRRTSLRAEVPGASPRLTAAIDRALSPEPGNRYRTAGEFEVALSTSLLVKDATARRRRRVLAGVGVVALASAATIGLWRLSSPPARIDVPARDLLLIGPLLNETGDSALDGAIDARLRRELTSSPQVNAAPQDRVNDTLRLMRRPAGTPLDRVLAHEVALRDSGIWAVLTGALEHRQDGFVVRLEVLDPATEEVVARDVESATTVPALDDAFRRAVDGLRDRFPYAHARVQRREPLERVTTRSLQALREYSESYRQGTQQTPARNWDSALALVRDAVADDPDFAVAHTWLAWALANTGAPNQDVRVAAARGVALSDGTQEWERHWIRGSYLFLTGDVPAAAREYAALVRILPDHYWGVWNLNVCYWRLGRYADAGAVARAWADRRPRDPDAQWRAVNALGRAGDSVGASPYVDRFVALRGSDDPTAVLFLAWKALAHAHEAFERRDAPSALAELRKVTAGLGRWSGVQRDVLSRHLAYFYLAMGRPDDARDAAARLSNVTQRTALLAEIALADGDTDQSRLLISNVPVSALTTIDGGDAAWVAIRTQAVDGDRILTSLPLPRVNRAWASWLHGETALRRGLASDAEVSLRHARQITPNGGHPRWYLASAALAEALEQQERLADAQEVLTEIVDISRHQPPGDPCGHLWMPAQLQLALLERRLGDNDSAQKLEEDLRRLLSQADPQFPLFRRLEAVIPATRGSRVASRADHGRQ